MHTIDRKIAIFGATGAVGQELLRLIIDRKFPVNSLSLFASQRSAGSTVKFKDHPITLEVATPESFAGCDIAFFSAGSGPSREFVPHALAAGALVIDNSSAFRMDPEVPLCVPEVNPDALSPDKKLIANPNCTAAILLMAVNPLRQIGEISRLIVSTYQSASGAGAQAMEELKTQSRDYLDGKPIVPKVMPHPYAFNLFSHNTSINEHGYNDEEWKVMLEARKILSMPELPINVTCVRVPVLRAHSLSVTVEFDGVAPSEEMVREVLSRAPGVVLVDDRDSNTFPMPSDTSGQNDVRVGRIRTDLSHKSAISMFICGDQLLKGAALNAIQIAEHYIQNDYL